MLCLFPLCEQFPGLLHDNLPWHLAWKQKIQQVSTTRQYSRHNSQNVDTTNQHENFHVCTGSDIIKGFCPWIIGFGGKISSDTFWMHLVYPGKMSISTRTRCKQTIFCRKKLDQAECRYITRSELRLLIYLDS